MDDPYVIKASSAPSSGGSDLFGTPSGHSKNGYDSDDDGIADSFDMDGDGITDAWDMTKDGVPDNFDTNGDGSPDIDISAPGVQTYDLDGNGIVDAWDTDGDGIADACDTDRDHIPVRFGASAAQFAGNPGKGETESKTDGISSLFTLQNIFIAAIILAVLGGGFYFKIYRPKHRDNGNSDDLDFEDDPDYRDEMSGAYTGSLSCDVPYPEREPERAEKKEPERDMRTMVLDDTKESDTSPITFVHRTDPDGLAVSFEKLPAEDEKTNERNEEVRQLKEKILKQKQEDEDLMDQKTRYDKGSMTGNLDDEWDKVTDSAMGMIIRDDEGYIDGLAPSFG